MKRVLFTMAFLFAAISFPMMAQNNVQSTAQAVNPKAKVEVRQGIQCLVLNTGINTSEVLSAIIIEVNDETWSILDGILAALRGAAAKMKDTKGSNVDVALAKVNSQTGLMFTSGSKCVAITKEEFDRLKGK
jgi:hypothetical protein